ncbi:hypothetical protein [Aeromonas sp. MrichA-1]|uniref:hypothetical protein n=1 Tax=Aeromonas sp. MrichA-1 TaxID=2823362 RepID=UPI001B323324|nr:hypothetical protein [Aeromonas sp. MrichA-1]MBP4081767.1 hypothetical protein [Aeromonas sp. MrichA-1]
MILIAIMSSGMVTAEHKIKILSSGMLPGKNKLDNLDLEVMSHSRMHPIEMEHYQKKHHLAALSTLHRQHHHAHIQRKNIRKACSRAQ